MGGKAEARRGGGKEGEEGALLRLPPLSFRCCAVQRQEGVRKGGVQEKKRRRGEGRRGSAWAALQQLQQPVRTKRGRKIEKAAGLPERKHFFAWFCVRKMV